MDNVQTQFDWYKNKNFQIKKRGNLSLLASSTFKNGEMVTSKQRYIWPESSINNDSRFITRRVWGRFE